MTKTREEYVYGMSNESYPEDTFKIGWTREHPSDRAESLYTSGVLNPFKVEFVIITPNGIKLEKEIHEHLKQFRIQSNREFFKIPKNELVKTLTDDLNLHLFTIDEINHSTKKTKNCKNRIIELFRNLEKDVSLLNSKLSKVHTELVVNNVNYEKIVSLKINNHHKHALDWTYIDHGSEEERIKIELDNINRDIDIYKKWIYGLENNYEYIQNNIGKKQMMIDNKSFKKSILETHDNFNKFKNKYIWKLDN